jgi:hypothetical protein
MATIIDRSHSIEVPCEIRQCMELFVSSIYSTVDYLIFVMPNRSLTQIRVAAEGA